MIDTARRRFLQGKIGKLSDRSSSNPLDLSVELVGSERKLDSDEATVVITYEVINSGAKRISVLIKYIHGELFQVIKMLHLGPDETYLGTWTETISQAQEPCSIEAEARCQGKTVTSRYNFESL